MNNSFNKLILSILFSVLISQTLFAQLSEDKITKIDSLFASWDMPNHPGGSIGIMQDGKLVYSKAFGLASLEYLVPITYDTQYNIASVSKQFTAFGICLMQLRGQLSVDDDIGKYLPELPKFKNSITIRHLLHHTSGLRSLHTLLRLAGWRDDDSRTNEDLMRFMKKQRDLNFVPGSEYMYCNTGYIFMAEIIERISGEEFTEWMDKNVFKPLGMYHTYVERHYNHVVKNNATSYDTTGNGEFKREVEYWGYVGSGNIHTNVSDLLIWLEQLRNPDAKWKDEMDLMKTTDNFNNGKHNKYAFGVNIDQYKNENRITHGGSIGGFRSRVCTYPDRKFSIAILTNFSSSNPAKKAEAITDIILDKKPTEPRIKPFKLSNEQFDSYAGRYLLSDSSSKMLDVYRIGKSFFIEEYRQNKIKIIPVSKNKFVDDDKRLEISFHIGLDSALTIEYMNQQQWEGKRIKKFIADKQLLKEICGTYWSQELETQYVIYLQDGKLMGHHARHGEFSIRYVHDNEFNGKPSFFNFFKVERNKSGNITGIYVTNSRVRDLWFKNEEYI